MVYTPLHAIKALIEHHIKYQIMSLEIIMIKLNLLPTQAIFVHNSEDYNICVWRAWCTKYKLILYLKAQLSRINYYLKTHYIYKVINLL